MPSFENVGAPGAKRPMISAGAMVHQELPNEWTQRSGCTRLSAKSGRRAASVASATSSGTRGSGARNSIGTSTSWFGKASTLPISKGILYETAATATSPTMTSGSALRSFGITASSTTTAARNARANAPPTVRSRGGIGCGRRWRADATSRSRSMATQGCRPDRRPTKAHARVRSASVDPSVPDCRGPRLASMNAAEIRERFLTYFEENDHRRMPSASLVPPTYDPSVLLTTAGMQPFKPYFRGDEKPPHHRLTSCQKCFRTVDIEVVGTTARHLTFFEMLGNFSLGDYFKEGAVEFATDLSWNGFGLPKERVWATVFGGDDELGLGPDEEAIECWRAVGIPDERIVQLGREDNFWQAGPTGPCGPCSELYFDRGPDFGGDDERPGDDSERYLEFWNLVFMQLLLAEDGTTTPLPKKNIDTGLGLDRMASILQDVPSVYETDAFRPLIELGQELSGKRFEDGDAAVQRALRILADHGRGMTFLLADGVVPSNEERGYVLRRIMRRAIQQGRVLGLEGAVLPPFCELVVEMMGDAYPELPAQRDTILKWARAEEESFNRTLAQGERLLSDLVRRAKEEGTSWIDAEDAFRLHDTFGFPYELTKELLAEEGLAVDDQGFEELMERAREVARGGAREPTHAGGGRHERVLSFARAAGFPTRFVGYETTEADTVLGSVDQSNGEGVAKLPENPFYTERGSQVADAGVLETPSGRASVEGVYRLGDDQAVALAVAEGELVRGEAARAVVDRQRRLATMANHTATHLLHAALRQLLGTHVRQAGSYVGPDKL